MNTKEFNIIAYLTLATMLVIFALINFYQIF